MPDATDPILNNFSIDFDASLATDSDIGTIPISYTVSFKDYDGIATELTDSFNLELKCPSTFTEDTFSIGPVTFDLVIDTNMPISLPTLSGIASVCYSVTWDFLRDSDDSDMLADFPSVFSISGTDLTITHPAVNDFQTRFDLYGSQTFKFRGFVTGPELTGTYTSDFTFVIDFQDSCRTANVVS